MTGTPPAWLGYTPTGQQLAAMCLEDFHQAIDQLHRQTVPRSYWERVAASRQAQAWDVR